MIVALVGRRVDPVEAETPRFPLANAEPVKGRILRLFRDVGATALVGSGACGADLLGMEAAGELGMRRRMVLPFDTGRFRESSVADRPGDWAGRFEEITRELAEAGDLVVLDHGGEPDAAYAAVNDAILDEAGRLAREGAADDPLAVVVWEGRSRGPGDLTAAFAHEAAARGLDVVSIPTLDDRADPHPGA
ncbi:MAG TPA: hypothetical protein VG406_05080 [Isosphaeraceae bacterium]|jgi:hypothetical protein|nr:hypothetical protein [Isosphaeraceae bacterium]